MRGYLETMGVTELAIEAHEKGESERDTFHTIELDDKRVKITKRSRVNHDLVVDLELGKESVQQLPPPGDRVETHLEIRSSLNTMNGMARVLDVKNLVQEEDKTVLVQALTVTNEQMGTTHTRERLILRLDTLILIPKRLRIWWKTMMSKCKKRQCKDSTIVRFKGIMCSVCNLLNVRSV